MAWTDGEGGQGETKGRGGKMTLRERERKSNWSSLISGPGIAVQARMALSLSLCHGDWGVTNGRLTCNGSHFPRAV